ncbi:MFS transporter [Nocardioides sp. CCNWLW239]|uniref:MFS transporter n=1 Tax=Nocardioides sp. CCNWLW239 TaxID=3128902 RepID=UPI00301AB325
MTTSTSAVPAVDRRLLRRVAFSSLLGTTIEYYDFLLYSTMAALVFGGVFFPDASPAVGTIAAFGTLAAGYIARPLGGLIFGHFGDRLGRKAMLILTMTLMGIASFLIGVIPTYATIGVAAPLLLVLLRVVQGIAVGGEWGGAALMVIEHAEPDRRGTWAAIMQLGSPIGFLLSTAAVALVSRLGSEEFMSWGWRLPFLASAVLLVIGLYVRLNVTESPVFKEAVERAEARAGSRPKVPVLQLLATPGPLLLACAAGIGPFALTALTSSHLIAYAAGRGYAVPDVMNALLFTVAVSLVCIPAFSALSDRVGRRRMILAGAAGAIVFAWPLYAMVDSGSVLLLTIGMMVAQVAQNAMYAPLAPMLSEMFGTEVRYTGVSLGYQLAALVGGGLTPLVASSLVAGTGGSSLPLTAIVAGSALVTVVALVRLGETRGRDLARIDSAG